MVETGNGDMKRLVVVVSLGLLCALAMGGVMLSATVGTVQADPPGVTYTPAGPDGWRVANMPAPVNEQALGVPGLFTVSVRTRPILDEWALPSVHPVARLLNTYWEVTAHPNRQLVAFNGQVTMDGEAQTANLPTQLSPQERADLAAKTGVKQHFKNGLSTLGHSLQMVPLSILCLPAIPLFVNEVQTQSRNRKEKVYTNRQTILLDEAWQQSGPYVQRVRSLQQQFTPNSGLYTAPVDANQGVYHVLPHKSYYDMDLTKRQVAFLPNAHPTLVFRFRLHQPFTAAQLDDLIEQERVATGKTIDTAITMKQPSSGPWVNPPSDRNTIALTNCEMRITALFTDVALQCSGETDSRTVAPLPTRLLGGTMHP
jgi:hypothetical protein